MCNLVSIRLFYSYQISALTKSTEFSRSRPLIDKDLKNYIHIITMFHLKKKHRYLL